MTDENAGASRLQRIEEAQDILHTMRQCRARLNRMAFTHAASHADIAVQLVKQAIAAEEQAGTADCERNVASSPARNRVRHDRD